MGKAQQRLPLQNSVQKTAMSNLSFCRGRKHDMSITELAPLNTKHLNTRHLNTRHLNTRQSHKLYLYHVYVRDFVDHDVFDNLYTKFEPD